MDNSFQIVTILVPGAASRWSGSALAIPRYSEESSHVAKRAGSLGVSRDDKSAQPIPDKCS
jgi:hypothetical protein